MGEGDKTTVIVDLSTGKGANPSNQLIRYTNSFPKDPPDCTPALTYVTWGAALRNGLEMSPPGRGSPTGEVLYSIYV